VGLLPLHTSSNTSTVVGYQILTIQSTRRSSNGAANDRWSSSGFHLHRISLSRSGHVIMAKKVTLYRGNIAYDEPARGGNWQENEPAPKKKWSIYAKYMYQKGRKTDDKVLEPATEQRLPGTDDSSPSTMGTGMEKGRRAPTSSK
jgi:hypothetical protein